MLQLRCSVVMVPPSLQLLAAGQHFLRVRQRLSLSSGGEVAL